MMNHHPKMRTTKMPAPTPNNTPVMVPTKPRPWWAFGTVVVGLVVGADSGVDVEVDATVVDVVDDVDVVEPDGFGVGFGVGLTTGFNQLAGITNDVTFENF